MERPLVDNLLTVLHWYDFICPFCYVAVRVLVRNPEKVTALAHRPGGSLQERSGGSRDHRRGDARRDDRVARESSDTATGIERGRQRCSRRCPARGEDHSKAPADSPIARRRGQFEIENGLIASGLAHIPGKAQPI